MMAEERFVIIGNGPAANSAAVTLRKQAPETGITLIGREPVRQYRPNLLPEFIAGTILEPGLYVRTLDFYKERGIKLRLGQEVIDVNFDKRELTLDHKEIIPFSGLIIATGGRPRIPEPLQVFEDLMMTLKTVTDAKAWIERLEHVESVLVIGGDLPSLGFTRALLKIGKKVLFILAKDSFWPLRFSDELRHEVAQTLADQGVNVIDCRRIKGMARISDRLVEVDTDCGAVRVGAVGAFFGLVPDVRFLARSRLYIERGIIVDEYLKTRFDEVYAAGDCAQVYHPDLKDYWVSIGLANAENLGRIAALNLAGEKVPVRAEAESIFCEEGVCVNTSWWSEF
jgi:NADPH-dependent 2,4-dienoyl-CoA reductase/sulfur reductase-like enzyme